MTNFKSCVFALLLSLGLVANIAYAENDFGREQIIKACIDTAQLSATIHLTKQEGSTWEDYVSTVERMFKDDEGRKNLIAVSYMVYHDFEIDRSTASVANSMYDSCIEGLTIKVDPITKQML